MHNNSGRGVVPHRRAHRPSGPTKVTEEEIRERYLRESGIVRTSASPLDNCMGMVQFAFMGFRGVYGVACVAYSTHYNCTWASSRRAMR